MNEESDKASTENPGNEGAQPDQGDADAAGQKRKRAVTPVSVWEGNGDGNFRRRKDLSFSDTATAEKWRDENGTPGMTYAILRVYSVGKIPAREVIEVTDY